MYLFIHLSIYLFTYLLSGLLTHVFLSGTFWCGLYSEIRSFFGGVASYNNVEEPRGIVRLMI